VAAAAHGDFKAQASQQTVEVAYFQDQKKLTRSLVRVTNMPVDIDR
jgi:hypothetical protein